jgi:tight adherence protein B
MSSQTLIPFLAVFATVALLFVSVWIFVARWLARRRELLNRRLAAGPAEQSILREEYLPGRQPRGWSSRFDLAFQRIVEHAGLNLDPGFVLGMIVLCGAILGAFMFVWRQDEEPWLALPAFLLGAAIPVLLLLWRQQAWRRTLRQQLPDAVFLLARSLRAGRSIEQAFELIGNQGVPPIAREFARMHQELELGLSLGQVLRTAADQIGLVDFNVFASVLTLHRTTGGNLPYLLDRLATTTRDRNQFEGQFRAATVLGRYSAGFIASMVGLILIYFFFFHREWAVRFFDTTYGYTGVVLFTTALGLELVGGALLFWLLRYDY